MNSAESLRLCGQCGCRFCTETTAQEVYRDLWRVEFCCPNCGKAWSRMVDLQALADLDRALDEDRRILAGELRILEEVGMAVEIEQFVGALEAGAILPMDF
jgi:hypothetical protein